MNKPKIDIITLGCSKNLVDSEKLMGLFEARGYHVTHDAEQPDGDIAVVNTCGFMFRRKKKVVCSVSMLWDAFQSAIWLIWRRKYQR